jgi:hypothetical protein
MDNFHNSVSLTKCLSRKKKKYVCGTGKVIQKVSFEQNCMEKKRYSISMHVERQKRQFGHIQHAQI